MEKPILFNTEMVKAILDGRKTMTRRIVKPQPVDTSWFRRIDPVNGAVFEWSTSTAACVRKLPYQVGDILWVRETWQNSECFDYSVKGKYCYREHDCDREMAEEFRIKWRPSIHMPRAAARLFLRVKNVRVERLQDITEEDALKEGFSKGDITSETSTFALTATQSFMWTWQRLYDKGNYPWAFNPWVWVIEFERAKGDK